MNISILTKGDTDLFQNMRWKRHSARINGWLNEYIYIIKEIDLSYNKSAKKESERNKNRFSIISNQDTLTSIVNTIFPSFEPTVAPSQKIKYNIWVHITEALIDLLYEVDDKVIDLIEGHILLISEDLHKLMNTKRGKNTSFSCIRDVPTTAIKKETKDKLGALRAIFDTVISDLLTKYKDLIKRTKKIYEDDEFQAILANDWDNADVLNTFAPLKVEIETFEDAMDLDNDDDEKEEERLKLKEKVLQSQKVVEEQSKSLRDEENQELQTKKRVITHLKQAVLSKDKDKPVITTNNIYQQLLEAEKTVEHQPHHPLRHKYKQEEDMERLKNKLAVNTQSTMTNSIESLAKKIESLNGSNAISTEHIVKVIQHGMHYIYNIL